MTPPRPELEALLTNAAWARALARSLVRDPHHADDLVQRTFVAAIEHPPRDSGSPRGWIASVLRNFARQDARAAGRRDHHERAGARSEATVPDAVDRTAAMHRELLAAVLALPEPYRSTIWARYYDGLAPREIARRDGIPVKTVKTRLVRGLAELRNRLDTDHGGDRSAWLAAMVPLAGGPLPSATLLGAMMVDIKLKIAGAVVAAAGVAVVLVQMIGQDSLQPTPLAQAPSRGTELTAPEPSSTPLQQPIETQTSARAAFEAPARVAPPVAAVAHPLRGRVLDLELRPVAGLEVFVRAGPRDFGEGKPTLATSLQDGTFSSAPREGNFQLAARGPGWTTVFGASNGWGNDDEGYLILVAPVRALAGRVVDPEHHPIAGATVNFMVDASVRRDVDTKLDTAMPSDWLVQTDADGRFALENAPNIKGRLMAEAITRKPAAIDAPTSPAWDLEIVLEPLEVKHLIVHGRVVDDHGQPMGATNVSLGSKSLVTGDDGLFAFDADDMRDFGEAEKNSEGVWVPRFHPDALFAVKPGKLPARLQLPPPEEMRRSDAASEFTLVLTGEPLEIRGRVLEADGSPVSNAKVSVSDETPFGMIYQKIGGEGIGLTTSAEKLLRGGTKESGLHTDKDGRFVLGGLLDREYHVIAFDPITLRRAKSPPTHAGSSTFEIRLPDRSHCVRVAGRVVGLDGTPIPGADVSLGAIIDDSRAPTYTADVATDELGRFEFAAVVSEGLTVTVTHASTFFLLGWSPEAGADLEKLEIKVARKAHLQIDLGTDTQKADEFAVQDEHGTPVDLMVSRGNMMWMPQRSEIVDGKSESLACSENGKQVVLYKAGKEVGRMPVRLVPGEITVVRP